MCRRGIPLKRQRGLSTAIPPKKVLVDLFRANQVLQLFQTGEAWTLEYVAAHINLSEYLVQLLRTTTRIPITGESWKSCLNLLERYAIAAIIRPLFSKSHLTAGKYFAHNIGDFLDCVILRGTADIENFIVDGLPGRLQRTSDRPTDIESMD